MCGMDSLSPSALAREAGVNQQTIRYYERRGLIPPPPRTGSGYREFPPDTIRRVRFIRQAQALGFTLREIKDLLDLRVRSGVGCKDIRQRAREKIEDIGERIAALERTLPIEPANLERSGSTSPPAAGRAFSSGAVMFRAGVRPHWGQSPASVISNSSRSCRCVLRAAAIWRRVKPPT